MKHHAHGGKASIGPVALSVLVGTLAVVIAEVRLDAESVNVTTFFSAPRGLYEELRVLRDVQLANDPAARVLVDPVPLLGGPPDKMVVDGTAQALRFVGPRIVPVGAIAIFRGACPAGWAPVGAFNGRAIRGAAAYGATFDAVLDHGHVLAHGHSTDDPVPALSIPPAGDHGHTVTGANHAHSYGSFGGTGGSGTVGPGMDGGSDWYIVSNHGHDSVGGGTNGASVVDFPINNTGDHDHAYDFPPTAYGGATGLNNSDSQPPSINVIFCSSP